MQGPTHLACSEKHAENKKIFVQVMRPIVAGRFYTMCELNMFVSPSPAAPVGQGACAPGDVLYIQHSACRHATRCVLVTQAAAAHVRAVELAGTVQFCRAEREDLFVPGARRVYPMLEWRPDAAQRAGKERVYTWNGERAAYRYKYLALVRCTDFPRRICE